MSSPLCTLACIILGLSRIFVTGEIAGEVAGEVEEEKEDERDLNCNLIIILIREYLNGSSPRFDSSGCSHLTRRL